MPSPLSYSRIYILVNVTSHSSNKHMDNSLTALVCFPIIPDHLLHDVIPPFPPFSGVYIKVHSNKGGK